MMIATAVSHLLITLNSSINFAIYCIKVATQNLYLIIGVNTLSMQQFLESINLFASKTLISLLLHETLKKIIRIFGFIQ